MARNERRGPFPWWLKTRRGYGAYLRSPEWAAFRERYFQKHSRKCFVCGTDKEIQLHHKSYRSVGHERPSDVVQLCRPHHIEVHALIRAKKAKLWEAHLAVAKEHK